jgi:hypothetical protein
MFMQLTGRASLRDGIQSINSRAQNLYHVGAKPVSRSTFADANNMRPASFYEALFEKAYQHCRILSPKHKVSRQKSNAVYRVEQRRPVNKKQGLTSDQTILLTGLKGCQCLHPIRRIGYRDPETKKHFVFITNNFKLSAKTIADIYKERWQIEIFFRWIKQNL